MKITVDGIVIREMDLGENDKVVTILARHKGLLRAIAKGSKSIKNKKTSVIQLFAYCRFDLYVGKNGYIIDRAEAQEMFFKLREDLTSLALAQYFCELSLCLAPEEKNSPEFLRLFLNSLFYLSAKSKSSRTIKFIFEMRACSICGYMPNLVGCYKCRIYKSNDMRFLIRRGVIACGECVKFIDEPLCCSLSGGTLAALRHTIYSPIDSLFSFSVSETTEEKLADISEKYILTHVSNHFKALEFYKSII